MPLFTSHSADETRAYAEEFAKTLRPHDIIAFTGTLGAGKTTFMQGLASGLGIDERLVASPTFSLMNEYRGGRYTVYHFDMYRITDYDALYSTGFFDFLEGDSILAIEWSENIREFLPPGTIWIDIAQTGDEQREICIERSAPNENSCR